MSMYMPVVRLSSATSPTRRGVGYRIKLRNNPMQKKLPMRHSPRCHAQTRKGSPCQSPAMSNGRCRMHGGMSPGALKGNRNAFKHGRYTLEAIVGRREIMALIRQTKEIVHEVFMK